MYSLQRNLYYIINSYIVVIENYEILVYRKFFFYKRENKIDIRNMM